MLISLKITEQREEPVLQQARKQKPLKQGRKQARNQNSARQTIIALDNVHLSLGSGARHVHILRGLDLEVHRGDALGLVGPSGSGKSSLLSVLAGLESPDSGIVTIAGQNISHLNEDQLALFRRDHIGIVFQSFHLIPNMTALENVSVPLEFAMRKDARAVAMAVLERVGLEDRAAHYPLELSGGEQQRVALARALAMEPPLLLADEPTGNLDSENGQLIADLLFDLQRERDATLILVTHDPVLAGRCDQVFALDAGKVVPQKPKRPA